MLSSSPLAPEPYGVVAEGFDGATIVGADRFEVVVSEMAAPQPS
jgi:hypothetical protein